MNIHGQGKSQIKLRKIKNSFTRGNFDLFLLQETRSDGSDKELKKWQKIFNTKHVFLTAFGTRAVGAGIVIRSDETFKVLSSFHDPLGRYVGVIGDHEDGKFLVISFYSPSISREIRDFIINTIYSQLESLGQEIPQFLILGGDSNTVFSQLDKQGGNNCLKIEAINAFDQLKQRFALFDSYRTKNPNKQEFSWEVLNPEIIRERLDIILVSNSLQDYVTETGIIPPHKTCSDHGIPYVKIKGFGIPSRGPGLWKLNNQLLTDSDYVSEMGVNIPKWLNEASTDLPNNIGGQWGFLKHKCGEFSRNYGAKLKKAKNLIKSELEKELKTLSENLNETNKTQYKKLQDQLNEFIEQDIQGLILRSLCEDYEQGEKCSNYFFSLEKYKARQKTINRVKVADGSFSSDSKTILQECRAFYKNLYSKNENVNTNSFEEFITRVPVPKLTAQQNSFCESNITLGELFKTLKSFSKNKSPGIDGLTVDFYVTFWEQLKHMLLLVYEKSFSAGILPECLRTGVITLIEKKGKDRLDIANWRPITLLNADYKLLTKTLGQRLKKVLPNLIHKDQNGFIPGGSIFFSNHTVRDILFYCKKENIDLIMLALDYTKAFDSLDFHFIYRTFEHFGFGERFQKWIKIIFNGGKSCVANNGYISENFEILRSTRQGDPISPLIFILGLEILFLIIRADENIKGVRIENNEIKLTAYADDASYFIRDKYSAENLLQKIELFSKISGLEVNRSKSECLILSFEVDLGENRGTFLGIPIVENLKVLGHFHGKSQLVCNYHNFYSKLEKIKKILSIWKQRNLTLFGKNLLINALSSSLFVFNSQIDYPPTDFIKLVEKLHKDFLWAGVPKISHNTIIASYKKGGIQYRDLNCFIDAINVKFLQNLVNGPILNHHALPNLWLKKLFKIPTSAERDSYFYNFFQETLNILDCKIKLPRMGQYRGHQFYYKILKTSVTLFENNCTHLENLLSIPIWFNKILNTKFDAEISRAGFNFVKDLFPENKPVTQFNGLRNIKIRKLRIIKDNIPQAWQDKIVSSCSSFTTVIPYQKLNLHGMDMFFKDITSIHIYKKIIEKKIRPPVGVLRWVEDFNVNDSKIVTGFTFAQECSKSTFDQVFQYKIMTQILPTNQYLARYRVRDSDICSKCKLVTDSVPHSLWSCQLLVPYVDKFLEFLRQKCKFQENIGIIEYIFGVKSNEALNHIFLEFKKEVFYNFDENVGVGAFCERIIDKVRKIMLKEKHCIKSVKMYEQYTKKWEKFITIYDFRGPDQNVVI